jgi:copper chaperone CopZ
MTCNNEVLKQLGTLRGVFGAEMDRIDGKIEVNHTDEISREEIRLKLDELGWKETPTNDNTLVEQDEPSIWGCVL